MRLKTTGFALIEVIVAIVLLGSVMAGAMTLVISAANAVSQNQNRLTGTYLAQECLEMARNVRDTAWRQNLPWDCALEEAPISACADLHLDLKALIQEENLVEILGEQSKFSRKLTSSKTGESRMVTCEVTWPRRSGSESIKISEILTNWRKK